MIPCATIGCAVAKADNFPVHTAKESPTLAMTGKNPFANDICNDSNAEERRIIAPSALAFICFAIFSDAPSLLTKEFVKSPSTLGPACSTASHPAAACCPKIAFDIASCSSLLNPFIRSCNWPTMIAIF